MSRCRNCNVIIADETNKCPLCRQVLEDAGEGVNKYPDLRTANRKLRLACNIILFISIVLGSIFVLVDYETEGPLLWSLIGVLTLVYLNVLMRVTVAGKSGYQFKTVCTTVMGILMLYGIDVLTGNHGWALNYVYPALVIAMDVTILVLMIVNRRNWQSYMMLQIFTMILSGLGLGLLAVDIVVYPYVMLVAAAASLFLFLGTLIIGDKRARNELKRRFHV